MTEANVAVTRKYLKSKILNIIKKYITNNIKKKLKKNIDFIKFVKFKFSESSTYSSLEKVIIVEKMIITKNEKIIFIGKLNAVVKIFDFRWKIPKKQNNTILILVTKLPRIKPIGKKLKTKIINKFESIFELVLLKIIIFLMIP